MKKIRVFWFLFGTFLFSSSFLMAQPGKYGTGPDSTECRRRLSFYKEYVRSKNYLDAVPSWRIAVAVCPRQANQTLYVDGQQILKVLMQQPGVTPERKQELVDSLMLMYDIRIQHYPVNANTALQNKIIDMSNFRPGAKEELMASLEELANRMGDKVPSDMLMREMALIGELYAENKRTAEDVMDTYSRLMALLEIQEEANPDDAGIKDAKRAVEDCLIASGVATCDNLITLFTPRFQANPDDINLVSRIVSMLTNSGCETSDLFLQAVTALNKLDPSYKTAYALSRMYAAKGEYSEAVKYLQEAASSPEAPAADKASYMIDQGVFYFRNLNNASKAMAMAKAAIEESSTVRGKAYMLMASIWAGQKCGETDIERRAPFWVATDYLAKAKAADPTCAEEADRLIGQYRGYFPLQEEAFMYDLMEGSSYTVTCGGMRETTTVRTKK